MTNETSTDLRRIRINGHDESESEVESLFTGGYLALIELDDGTEWYVAKSSEAAGEAAESYWRELAESDPEEFRCMVGDENLIRWALGQLAGPGSTQVYSLDEWLALHQNAPEEFFASYNGVQRDVEFASPGLVADLGFTPTVAYRHK